MAVQREKMACKMYVRPWPLTSGCKHGERFNLYKCENFAFFCDSLIIFSCNPCQTFRVDRPWCDLQVWKILWTLVHKRRWTLRLKNLKFLQSRIKIATLTSCSSENRNNFEKGKQTGSSTICRLLLLPSFIKTFAVVAEIGCLVPICT